MDDRILLEQISRSNPQAFDHLIRQYYPSLVRFVSGILRTSHGAEDIAQEVFTSFWEERADAGKIRSLRNYLYVSARNLAINHLRSEERLKKRHDKALTEEDFQLLVIEEETLRLLTEAIESLPARSATVLKLTIQGLSLEEIAARMQVSINTVKSTKAYAISKIKKALDPPLSHPKSSCPRR